MDKRLRNDIVSRYTDLLNDFGAGSKELQRFRAKYTDPEILRLFSKADQFEEAGRKGLLHLLPGDEAAVGFKPEGPIWPFFITLVAIAVVAIIVAQHVQPR